MTWAMKTRDLLRQGREEGREEGYREGFEETFEVTIRAFVSIVKDLSLKEELATQILVENFGQSPGDAEKKMKLYWGK